MSSESESSLMLAAFGAQDSLEGIDGVGRAAEVASSMFNASLGDCDNYVTECQGYDNGRRDE